MINVMRRVSTILAAGALFALANPQARSEELDFSGGLLDRQAAMEAAKAVSTNRYPDADEVLVAGMRRAEYNSDGTYAEWHEEFVKVLTEKGRRSYLTVSSYFTIPYQRGPEDCRIPLLEIIRPGGDAVSVDVAKQSRIMINPGAMAANIYNPNEKVIQVNVPGVEVGDLVHFVMFDRIVHPRMRDTWCDWVLFEDTRPIASEIVEIWAPTDRPLVCIMLKDEVQGTVTSIHREEGDRILYRWEARDVPRMFPEPNMPPLYTGVQRLLVSTMPDWQTVSRWYWKLSEPHYAPSEAMKEQIDKLIRGLNEPQAKMEAIFRFVAQQVRYMGITVEATSPGYEPHDVKDTFEARHGVCRDKAALLVVMLRLAEFEAFPVLIATETKKDPEVPQPYFNHAIAAVREAPGQFVLMDPTDETAVELLPAYLNDKSYLVATPEGDPLRTSPIDPAENNLMRIRTEGVVDADGRLSAETVLRFDGVNDNAYRGWFARVKPEQRRRFFEGLMKAAVPGARLSALDLLPADVMDVSTTMSARVRFEADDILVRGQGLNLLPLPAMGTRVGMVNFIIGQTGLRERKYPLQTEMACGVQEHITLSLPPSLDKPEFLPKPDPMDTSTVLWQFDVRQTNGVLTADADFRLKVTEFRTNDYLELKDALKKVEQDLREMPGYPASGNPEERLSRDADAIVLDERVEYNLIDKHNWTERRSVRKKVLTYAGKKQNSELKLSYNTAWEDVKIERALVTAPDGTKREISAREINVMDAPWVGSARRYPPGKVLVASFPAVEVGSTIEYAFTRSCKGRPFFSKLETVRYFDALARKTVRITAPAAVAVHWVPLDFEDLITTSVAHRFERGEINGFEWTATNMPPVEREEMLPPWWTFNPTIFATTGDWREYARTVNRALTKAASGQRQAARKAREIVRDVSPPPARIKAIRDFVAMHARDVGPRLDEVPLSAVTPADRTLADGYGNSADRAVLLAAMLKAIGVRPEFVLVSAEPPLIGPLKDRIRELPNPAFFGEVLVSAPWGKGTCYLNDTDQYAPVGASRHDGECGLALPGGRLADILAGEWSGREIAYELAVGENGDVELTKEESLSGMEWGQENKRFSEMTPEERRRHFQEMIARISQAGEGEGDLITDFVSMSTGRIMFKAKLPCYAVRDGNYLYVSLPETLGGMLGLKTETRANPLYLSGRGWRSLSGLVYAPPGYRVRSWPDRVSFAWRSAPNGDRAEVDLEMRRYEGGFVVKELPPDGRTVEVDSEIWLSPVIVERGRYQELLNLDQALSPLRNRTVVFEKVGESPEGGTTNALVPAESGL